MNAKLAALVAGAFAIGNTEFVVVGLLPQIAEDLAVTEGTAGQLVTLNAVAVAVGAPLLGALLARRDRRAVMLGALVVFAAAHAVAALAPSFAVLLATRVVGGAAFGLYIASALAAAAHLAPVRERGRAMATVVAGISAATALGVPLGTLLGQGAGWRAPFAAIGALAVVAAVMIARSVPRLGADTGPALPVRLAALRHRPVVLGIAAIAAFWAASFTAYTYLVPLLVSAGLGGGAVTLVLFATGLAAVAGNLLGGRAADRALTPTLLVTALVTAAALLLLGPITAMGAAAAVVLVVLWQLAAWSYVPAGQVAVHRAAGQAGDLAVSFTVSAFNIGIVAGAGIGGVVIDTAGLSAVVVVAGVLGVAAAALVLAAAVSARAVRQPSTTAAAPAGAARTTSGPAAQPSRATAAATC